jgi:polyisoprenoid-binding protein YceI
MTVVERTNVIPDGTYAIDPTHSSASFAVRHAVSTFRGGFKAIEGRLQSDGGEAKLTGSANVDSIDVEDEDLRPHLLSPDFFDLERAPQIGFSSTSIDADGEELVVRGELRIAGATHEVEARGPVNGPGAGPGGGDRIGLELRGAIDRTEYGMNWNMELPDGSTVLGDEVELLVDLELVQDGE